ncbi:hypothetical protein FACS1894156_1320 [Bacteroidia bacterium]|nr:hypothetical protein FACS1894156_1320 [Bacteroidia bacterium]
MKKIYVIVCAVSAIALASCGSSKPVSVVAESGAKEVSVPCSDLFTDKDFFRGQGSGTSKDLNTAREKARMVANAELAGSVQTLIRQVGERYVNDAGQSPADYGATYESLTRQVVEQTISNVRVACNKSTQTKDGMYTVYLAVEAGKDEIFAAIDRAAAADKKIETLYEREKFRATYNEELEAFAKNRGR